MKKPLILIGIAIVVGVVILSSFSIQKDSESYLLFCTHLIFSNYKSCTVLWNESQTQMVDDDIVVFPSSEEFLRMDCENLNHMFPDFPSEDVADAWITRMHECINEQESLIFQTNESGLDKQIAVEMEKLQQMSCGEIIQRNTEGKYFSSDNREFAREKTLDCSDIEESFAVNASCEELYERYHSGQEYWFEDHKQITENRLAKCLGLSENEI